MVNSSESAAKEEWVATVTQLLLGIEQALSSDSSGNILKESSSTAGLVRLTNNLIQVSPGSLSYAVSAGVSLITLVRLLVLTKSYILHGDTLASLARTLEIEEVAVHRCKPSGACFV